MGAAAWGFTWGLTSWRLPRCCRHPHSFVVKYPRQPRCILKDLKIVVGVSGAERQDAGFCSVQLQTLDRGVKDLLCPPRNPSLKSLLLNHLLTSPTSHEING